MATCPEHSIKQPCGRCADEDRAAARSAPAEQPSSPLKRLYDALLHAGPKPLDAWVHVSGDDLAWACARARAFSWLLPDADLQAIYTKARSEIAAELLNVPLSDVEALLAGRAGAPPAGDTFDAGVRACASWFRAARANYPESVFREDSDSPDANAARAIRWVCDEWTTRAERELLGGADGRPPAPPADLVVDPEQAGVAELLEAVAFGADVSGEDMARIARVPLATIAAIAAQAGLSPTSAAGVWLLAQVEDGTLEVGEEWTWHPTSELARSVVLRIDLGDDD